MEEVAKAVGGSHFRLQMPLKLAPAVRETVAGHRLGALEGGGGLPMHPWPCPRPFLSPGPSDLHLGRVRREAAVRAEQPRGHARVQGPPQLRLRGPQMRGAERGGGGADVGREEGLGAGAALGLGLGAEEPLEAIHVTDALLVAVAEEDLQRGVRREPFGPQHRLETQCVGRVGV